MNAPPRHAEVIGGAVRAATRFDRGAVSVRTGLIPAVPVAGALAVGAAVDQPVGAISVAVGAMFAGVAWRAGGGPANPPLETMAGSGVGLAMATLLGTLSGRWPWLHLGVLAVFCLVAGLLTALGRRGGVVGTQSVIAFIVFGRFPESLSGAATLAGLVLGGAVVQIAWSALIASPAAWRRQREAVAGAYRALAELAENLGASSVPAATALDAAEARLSAPSLFGDSALMALSGLVDEGRRVRLELIALHAAAEQARQAPDDAAAQRVLALRLGALGGQVRAAARLAEAAAHGGRLWSAARPARGTRAPLFQLREDVRRLRATATLQSAAGRHAVRLAVVVTGTELLIERVALPRAYWAVVAAATVLRPEFAATLTRGAERLLGTFGGVLAAGLIAVAVQPSGWGIVAIVGVLVWGSYAVFPASFAAGMGGLTAMIVFLLHAVAPGSLSIALDRALDTAIGGAIGLVTYLVWPTWSGRSVPRLLAAVADAQRIYVGAVLDALVVGAPLREGELRPLARRARTAYSDAEATVTLAQSEPPHGFDATRAATALKAMRRTVYAGHALRVEAGELADRPPLPALAPLADGVARTYEAIAAGLRGEIGQGWLPNLRAALHEAAPAIAESIRLPLDELVDATNSVAASLELPLP